MDLPQLLTTLVQCVAIITPIIILNSNISKLSVSVEELARRLGVADNELTDHTRKLEEHEIRITKLEEHEK